MADDDDERARVSAINDQVLAAHFDDAIRPLLVESAEGAARVVHELIDRGVDPVAAVCTTTSTINAHLINTLLVALGYPGWEEPT